MKTFFAYFVLTLGIILAPPLALATDVCGNVSGVWDLSGSPYMVNCDVTVPAGQALEIRAGVLVRFTGSYQFLVNGLLRAIGTASDSIRFTTDTLANPSRWKGVRLEHANDASLLSYCIVEDAHWPDNQINVGGGGVRFFECSPTISNSTVRRFVSIRDGGGIQILNSSATVAYCHVSNCYCPYGGGINGGIVSPGAVTNPIIDHCVVEYNRAGQGGGIAFWEGNITISNCTIVGNHGDDAGGVRMCSEALASIVNTIFVGNSVAAIASYDGQRVNTNYSCFWQNGFVGQSSPGIGVLVSNNANGDPCDIYHNIFLDPQFANPAFGDYQLIQDSPCIDSGDPNSPHDPDNTVADIGAFPYPRGFIVAPSELDYGQLDFGTDSMQTVSMTNSTSLSIRLVSFSHALSAFVFDTTGLNGAVLPHSTYHLNVTFRADAIGPYEDTLVIVASQPDSVIRIPLSGEAQILLPPVDSLVIKRGTGNAMQLNWAAVTHTISGHPFTPPYYIIYGATSPSGPFVQLDASPVNSYTHTQFTLPAQYFYRVTAATE